MIFRVYYKRRGGDFHCQMFSGIQAGALGKCGDLVMKVEEFKEFFKIRGIEFLQEPESSPEDNSLTDPSTMGGERE